MTTLAQIDPFSPKLTPMEQLALCRLLTKRENYARQGRVREAHGIGQAILIYWLTLHDFADDATIAQGSVYMPLDGPAPKKYQVTLRQKMAFIFHNWFERVILGALLVFEIRRSQHG